MKKIGLEKEYFLSPDKPKTSPEYVLVPQDKLPYDECGYLVEARGRVCGSVREAVFSLLAEERRLKKIANTLGLVLIESPCVKVSRALLVAAARVNAKGRITYDNIYGFQHHRNTAAERCAAVHISFTDEREVLGTHNDDRGRVLLAHNVMFDWVKPFVALDKAFKKEIYTAKRRPGFYELKVDGRIEYRSLPNNVDLMKVIDVLEAVPGLGLT